MVTILSLPMPLPTFCPHQAGSMQARINKWENMMESLKHKEDKKSTHGNSRLSSQTIQPDQEYASMRALHELQEEVD